MHAVTALGVPCFVLLSGAFLLSNYKNRDIGYFYKKSFFNIFLPAIIISLGYSIYEFIYMYKMDLV